MLEFIFIAALQQLFSTFGRKIILVIGWLLVIKFYKTICFYADSDSGYNNKILTSTIKDSLVKIGNV